MKRKWFRKVLIPVLVMALMIQIACPAFAAAVQKGTYTWVDDEYTYIATVTPVSATTKTVSKEVDRTTHTKGTATTILSSVEREYTVKAVGGSESYATQVNTALARAGLLTKYSFDVPKNAKAIVPAIAPSGNYILSVRFSGYTASWVVTARSISLNSVGMQSDVGTNAAGASGTFSFAPIEANPTYTYTMSNY